MIAPLVTVTLITVACVPPAGGGPIVMTGVAPAIYPAPPAMFPAAMLTTPPVTEAVAVAWTSGEATFTVVVEL